MASDAPNLFDGRLLALRRRRAAALARMPNAKPADFLLTIAIDDICDRLALMRRVFASALVFGAHAPDLVARLLQVPGIERVTVADHGVTPFQAIVDRRVSYVDLPSLEALGMAEQPYDLIVSPLMLQWVNDLPGLLVQFRRALRPDGLLIANLVGGRTLHEFRSSFLAAEAQTAGSASPRVSPMVDVRELGGLLQRAKFALPVTDADAVVATYPHVLALMGDLRAMGATNVLAAQRRVGLRRDVLAALARQYFQDWPKGDGRIAATFEIVTMTAWSPHESQQKPLKPGSAQQRLADALKVRVVKDGDRGG